MRNDDDPEDPPPEAAPDRRTSVRGLDAAGLFGLVNLPSEEPGWTLSPAESLAEVLPGYEIVRLIGRGGMGAVYEAKQLNLERPVAVKVLPVDVIGTDASFADRFRREALILSRLPHPNIVGIFELGSTLAGDLFFTMELVNGETLAARLMRSRPGQGESVALLRQVCDAVAYAHEQGIIHRDLKPSNILISNEGRVKVADFGLAVPQTRLPSEKLTNSGLVVGTLDYLAPEQWQGAEADVRSDIYCLGVIAYQLLTGEVPRGAFDPPSFRRGSVDPGFDDVILRALQMDPRRRYAGAQEFRDALVAAYETALLADPGELTGESQAQVLETFYENVISGLPETVRFYVEDKLLTPSGYRDSRALDEALSSPGITRTSLDRLIENRLLRIEERAGVPRVEISHDRLTRVIQASRDARRAKEERRLALERENRLRRQLRFRIMMVLGLSAVLCIVTWGLWQHRVASIKARDESIARAQVRALMDTFSGELLNHLERLGKLSVQDPVFATLDAIFKEYPPSREDPEFLVLRARFLKSQGDSLAVRGRRSAAAGALREALLIFRELNADGAAVECALSAAEALTAQGRAAFAKTELENAAPLMAKLDSGAGSSVLRAQWARQMSRALSGLRQRDHAVEEAGRAVQVLKEIPPGHPGLASGRFNRELALAEADLAEALDETNDLFQGLVHHRMADRLMDDALSADSPDFRWHGEAANIRGALSAALLNSDNKEEGAKVAESALARTTALVSRDPENMPWRRAHAVALEWMGEIRSKEKDYAGAASCLEKAVEQIRIVSGEDPTIEVVQWDLASILLQAGYLRSDQQEAAGAEPFFYEALNVMIPFTLNDDIPVPGRIYGLAAAISNLGDCLKDQRQDQAASALYVEWETRALTLVPAHPLWRFLAADSEWNRAQLTWNGGDKPAALALFGKSLKQMSQLHGELPAEDAPSAGWAWRERFGKRANPVIRAAIQEGPPLSAEGRNLATQALRVLFEEWKVDPFPDADKVIKSELEKMLAP